jgi:acetyltransferase-like isoleucine patch superfamily enzyme
MSQEGRRLPGDWYAGTIPHNVEIDETAYIETSYSFREYRSEQPAGIKFCRGSSAYKSTMFDVGPKGQVTLGEYALVHGARIICDSEILIGDFTLISWNVLLMDTYRLPLNAGNRRRELELVAMRNGFKTSVRVPALPIRIERNVWIGFESCVLPGVLIGEGSIIGARSVVTESVEPFTIVAGNPAAVVRRIPH